MTNSNIEKLLIEVEAKDLLSRELLLIEQQMARFGANARKSLSLDKVKVLPGDAPAQLARLEQATNLAARGVGRLGSAFSSELGPAGQVVGGLTAEVIALGGGLEGVIGKAGLSSVALVGLGAGAAAVALGVGGLGVAAKSAYDVEQGLKAAVVAGSGLGLEFKDIESAALATSNKTGVAFEQVGAAFAQAFQGGAKSIEEARRQVELSARALQDVGLGSDLPSAFRELKDTAEAFGVPAREMPFLLNQIKVGALEAGQSTTEFAASLRQSALDARRLGASREDILKLTVAAAKGGASAEQAGRAVRAILNTLSDPGSSGFRAIRLAGVDLSDAAFKAKGLLGVLAEVREKVDGSAQRANTFFGTRNAGPIQAALGGVSAGTSSNIDQAGRSLAAIDAAKIERTALASTQLADAWNSLSNSGASLGGPVLAAAASSMEEVALAVGLIGAAWDRVFGDSQQEKALRSADAITRVTAEIGAQESALESLLATKRNVEARKDNPVTRAFDEASPLTKDLDLRIADAEGKLADLRSRKVEVELALNTNAADAALGAYVASPKRITVEVELAQQQIADALKDFEGKTPPIKVQAQVSRLLDLSADPTDLAIAISDGSFAKDLADLNAYQSAVQQAETLLATLQDRTLVGAERQRAEGERLIAQTERTITALRAQGVEEEKLQAIRAEIPRVQAESNRTADLSIAKQTADIEAKMLGLRATSLDRQRDLALASGDVARADQLGIEALNARAAAAQALGEIEIANLREQIRGREDLRAQFEAIAGLIRRNAEAEAAAARIAAKKTVETRARNTGDAIGDADSALLTGLDAEYNAIERNRLASIRKAQDAVNAGTVEATALGYLIDRYGDLADAERKRLDQENDLRAIEIEAGLVGELADSYTAQARAIELSREAERTRLALSLAGMNAEQGEIDQTLALFDRLTQQKQFQAAANYSRRSTTEIEETALLEAAFERANREAKALGLSGEDAGKHIQDAMLNARSGVDALGAGFRGGFDDFKRGIFDDFSFGAEAARNQAQTFKDSWIDALGSIGEKGKSAGDILREFGIANLRQLQKNLAEYAFNQLGQVALGPPESRKDGPLSAIFGGAPKADPLAVSADRLTGSAALLDNAAVALLSAAQVLGPSTQGGTGFFQGGPGQVPFSPLVPQGPGNLNFSPNDFVSVPGGFDPGLGNGDAAAADSLADAALLAGDALEEGAQAGAQAIVAGGDVFGAGLTGILGGLGNQLSGFLSSGLGGFLSGSFAEGGRFKGRSMRTLSPIANRLGGKYSNRTLIEVAEVPGLEEAVIPLKGGAIPVEVKPTRRREDPRLGRGPIDDLVERFGQLDLQEQRLRADAPAERERERQRALTDYAVRQADTRRAPSSDRRAVGIGRDRDERRAARRERDRARVVNVGGTPNVTQSISISVQAGPGEDAGQAVLRAMPQIEARLVTALEGANRQLVNAVRGVVS